MKIIDYEAKGNLVRFYVGTDDLKDYWGDDWSDTYCNDTVYKEFVSGIIDVAFDFNYNIYTPNEECINKEDLKDRLFPCCVIINEEVPVFDYKSAAMVAGNQRIYFEDNIDILYKFNVVNEKWFMKHKENE